jgi:hypothetical protein
MVNVDLQDFFGETGRVLDVAGITGGTELFHRYDSYRAYSWLVRINGVGGVVGSILSNTGLTDPDNVLTLAAKQVGQIGYNVEDIMVDRVNDKFYYPGRPSTEETVITFDNLLKGDAAKALFNWMRTTYDPITGTHSSSVTSNIAGQVIQGGGGFKRPQFVARMYGAYCKNWRLAEFNYSANEFHSIECTVRYDMVGYFRNGDNAFEDILNPVG